MIALALLIAPASATYAKSQTFDIVSSTNLTGYQMKLILSNASGINAGNIIYTNGATQFDWRDIKFNWTVNTTDQNIDCPYWLETKNQTASTITVYVRVPHIYTNNTSGLKFFYNDSSATSNSNGANTFPFFDDFTTSGLNSTWVQNGTGTVTAGGGTCTILGGDIHIRSSTASFGTNQMLLTRMQTNKWGATTGLIQGGFNYYGGSDSNENYYTQVNFAHISSSLTRTIAQATGGSSTYTQVATGAWNNTSYHRLELIRTDASSILYTDDTYRSTLTGYYPTVALYPYYRCYYSNDSVVVDYVAVRQYTGTPPTLVSRTVTATAPNNYTHYKDVLFTQNMTSWDFVSNLRTFYTSFMPEWFFWLIILTIPYIGMYNRQGGVEIIAVIYLFTGSILATVMPAVIAPFAKWFMILGAAGMIYKLFIRD
jgi:Domain of unknown function (DUF2341).